MRNPVKRNENRHFTLKIYAANSRRSTRFYADLRAGMAGGSTKRAREEASIHERRCLLCAPTRTSTRSSPPLSRCCDFSWHMELNRCWVYSWNTSMSEQHETHFENCNERTSPLNRCCKIPWHMSKRSGRPVRRLSVHLGSLYLYDAKTPCRGLNSV